MSHARLPLVFATLLALTSPALAEDARVQRTANSGDNVVLTNLFMYAFGIFNFEYERAVTDRIGVAAGVTAIYSNGTPFDSSLRSRGAGVNAGVRYYLTGRAPQGLYVAGFARAFRASIEESGEMDSGNAIGAGAMVGYAHTFWGRLHVSGAGGAHVLVGDVAGTHLMPSGRTLDPELRVAVGVTF